MVGTLDSLMLPISQKAMEDVGGVKIRIVGFIQYWVQLSGEIKSRFELFYTIRT